MRLAALLTAILAVTAGLAVLPATATLPLFSAKASAQCFRTQAKSWKGLEVRVGVMFKPRDAPALTAFLVRFVPTSAFDPNVSSLTVAFFKTGGDARVGAGNSVAAVQVEGVAVGDG